MVGNKIVFIGDAQFSASDLDARVHVAHLKSVFGKGDERAEEILGILAGARESSIEVTAGMYPYNASYTGIDIVSIDAMAPKRLCWVRTLTLE